MTRAIEAVYERGVFRPLEPVEEMDEGQKVALSFEPIRMTPAEAEEALAEWRQVYAGLSEADVAEVEAAALDRAHFSPRGQDQEP